MKNKFLILLLSLFFISSNQNFPQKSKLFNAIEFTSNYILSKEYYNNLKNKFDLQLIDLIYNNQLKHQKMDIKEALLSLTFALVQVRVVSINFPILGTINYPLVSVNDSLFELKNKFLPKQVFWDSNLNDFGDKDKLSHFFGSAFISYNSNIFDFGDLIGYFIEVFEEVFQIQSSIDKRDMMTNYLGNIFGDLLKYNKNILPSQVLITNTLIYFNYNL
ncbi:MAG: hypothetical protein CO128_05510 [Ignavibacteriales bacterium CG_4_9_14_3_um_filter_30_11]|nr:MAG: hypothetical protein CO128_05510 [Ignavibacteriales bacterium CG_4_9_14_3_um_filter_30_11]